MNDDAALAGHIAQGGEGHVLVLLAHIGKQAGFIPLHQGGHFRCLYVVCPLGRSLSHQGDGGIPIGKRIAPGPHLDTGRDEAGLGLVLFPSANRRS